MKSLFSILILAFSLSICWAQENPDGDLPEAPIFGDQEPTAEQIIKLARYSQALQNHDLTGHLRPRGLALRRIPLKISLFEKDIRFMFHKEDKSKNDIDQIIKLSLRNNRYEMTEIFTGKPEARIPEEKYGAPIRGTDVTYEDLSMRFLYWPNPEKVGEDKVGRVQSWIVAMKNPLDSGPYDYVKVWVGQNNGAMMRVEGWKDVNGTPKVAKVFRVDQVQRGGDGTWVLEQMEIHSYNVETGKIASTTLMEIDDPKRK
ncbi:MAG: outer membrane lipoprotein-sorting protein [Verrucomicrobiota bacterium]